MSGLLPLRSALSRSRARARQLLAWVALGVAAVGVEIALLGLLYERLGLALPLASALAAEALILARFVLADRWVFHHARPTFARLWRYHGASAGSFAVSWVVLNGAATLLGVRYVAAALLATAASFVWSLATNFLWVWAGPRAAPLAAARARSEAAPPAR